MDTVTSADGTPIAFDRFGQGPHVILVGGAFQHRAFDPSITRLASILAERFTVLKSAWHLTLGEVSHFERLDNARVGDGSFVSLRHASDVFLAVPEGSLGFPQGHGEALPEIGSMQKYAPSKPDIAFKDARRRSCTTFSGGRPRLVLRAEGPPSAYTPLTSFLPPALGAKLTTFAPSRPTIQG
jgi:hypothetical protein